MISCYSCSNYSDELDDNGNKKGCLFDLTKECSNSIIGCKGFLDITLRKPVGNIGEEQYA